MEEKELIGKAKKGDTAAFEELVRSYEKYILNICYGYTRNLEDSKDMAQETLLKIWRALPLFEGKSAFSTWIYRIAVNVCKSNSAKKRAVETREEWELIDSNTPEDEAIKKEKIGIVRRGIMALDDEAREVIILRDINGMSYEEIAESLEIPLGTVKSRINRGRMKLIESVGELL